MLSFFVPGKPAPQPDDLPRHIARRITIDVAGCWLFGGSRSRDGYGLTSLKNKTYQAHRLVYRLLVGEPPDGLVLDHLCRVRHCVNPRHLQPVTAHVNLLRGETPAGRTTCSKGHPLEWNGRQRRCRLCEREWRRAYQRDFRAGKRRRAA